MRSAGSLQYHPARRYIGEKNCLPCMGSPGPMGKGVLCRVPRHFVCLPGRTGRAAVASLSLTTTTTGDGLSRKRSHQG